ncbi:MAG: hypothetical protein JNL47_10625 [Bacteroidia bacterium]|nr:hypothetical protein [Bacteroidia bacterium]
MIAAFVAAFFARAQNQAQTQTSNKQVAPAKQESKTTTTEARPATTVTPAASLQPKYAD